MDEDTDLLLRRSKVQGGTRRRTGTSQNELELHDEESVSLSEATSSVQPVGEKQFGTEGAVNNALARLKGGLLADSEEDAKRLGGLVPTTQVTNYQLPLPYSIKPNPNPQQLI